jgi:hypothetical protein
MIHQAIECVLNELHWYPGKSNKANESREEVVLLWIVAPQFLDYRAHPTKRPKRWCTKNSAQNAECEPKVCTWKCAMKCPMSTQKILFYWETLNPNFQKWDTSIQQANEVLLVTPISSDPYNSTPPPKKIHVVQASFHTKEKLKNLGFTKNSCCASFIPCSKEKLKFFRV